ncbi:MAG: hypothetical protein HC933_01370 [Pleurocapsa sp. SU_196_0]|nr:hypothetical protein [Pleurocapsa sp. SU_196_0]
MVQRFILEVLRDGRPRDLRTIHQMLRGTPGFDDGMSHFVHAALQVLETAEHVESIKRLDNHSEVILHRRAPSRRAVHGWRRPWRCLWCRWTSIVERWRGWRVQRSFRHAFPPLPRLTVRVQIRLVNAWGHGVVFYDVPSEDDVRRVMAGRRLGFVFVPPQTPTPPRRSRRRGDAGCG